MMITIGTLDVDRPLLFPCFDGSGTAKDEFPLSVGTGAAANLSSAVLQVTGVAAKTLAVTSYDPPVVGGVFDGSQFSALTPLTPVDAQVILTFADGRIEYSDKFLFQTVAGITPP
jgi:hypothetical protein